jgi:hypothetical protein
MILQVNDISFEGLSNDDAVKILRESVQQPGYDGARHACQWLFRIM